MKWLVAVLACVLPSSPSAGADPLILTQTQPLRGVVQLALGAQHSCARRGDGSVVCWGDGSEGQRGDGQRGSSGTPSKVRRFAKLVSIESGAVHSCAVTTSEVWCWGSNRVYELGVGDATNPKATLSGLDRDRPTRTRRFGKVAAIALGDVSYAIAASGAVTCVGHSNFCGWEIATGKVPNLPPITSAAVGDGHACGVSRAGEVYCWGRTDWGQGGSGLDHTDQGPMKVEGLHDIVEIAAGGAHTCARSKTGTVYCWGLNDKGQLGDGTTTQRNRPVQLQLTNVEQLAIGGFGSCARLTGGTVTCWGSANDALLPTAFPLKNVLEIAAGGAHMCARLGDDTVRCWGENGDGQLGDGSMTSSAAPVTVID